MFQHLADHVDVPAGCVVCILVSDHVRQFLIGGNTDHLLSRVKQPFRRLGLCHLDSPEHRSAVGNLRYQILIIIPEADRRLHIRIQCIYLLFKSRLQPLCQRIILRMLFLPEL